MTNVDELIIPTTFEGSALTFLTQRLPHGLILNHQTHEEAALAYLRRTLSLAEDIVVPGPETLLLETPSSLVFKRVRCLEFTRQQGDSMPSSAPSAYIYNVASRCPELRKVTIAVTAAMLITADKGSNTKRLKTMEEIEESMKLTQLLENKNLCHVQLICSDAAKHAQLVGKGYNTLFEPFAEWFIREINDRGLRHRISMNIMITPRDGYNPNVRTYRTPSDYELSWHTEGRITYYWYQDFFG